MHLYRYMVGDTLAGGCVLAANDKDATTKVRAFYDELATYSDNNALYVGAEITVWRSGEGFIKEFPDVVEVYP